MIEERIWKIDQQHFYNFDPGRRTYQPASKSYYITNDCNNKHAVLNVDIPIFHVDIFNYRAGE